MRSEILYLLFVVLYSVESHDVTLTFFYDRTSYLPCERVNSDNSSVWLKNNIAINISADANIDISLSGSLIFQKFSFSDTGDYQCQGSDITYTLIIDCPSNSEPDTFGIKCVCSPGATKNVSLSSLTCYLCLNANFKPSPGEQPCSPCPTSLLTEREGAVSLSDCVCPPGEGIVSSLCVPCPSDSYQDEFSKSPCIQCPLYSATPQPLGEAEAEGFTSRSDCLCQYSPFTAANSTCWPFVTAPVVALLSIGATNVTIQWLTQSYARADDGAYRGVVAGYHLEVRTTGPLRTNIFTHKYTPADYTVGENFNLTLTALTPGTPYSIVVNAFTKSSSFVDGPPFNLTVMTSTSAPVTHLLTTHTHTTGSPGLAHDTTATPPPATGPTTGVSTTSVTTTLATSTAAPSTSTASSISATATTEQHGGSTTTVSTPIYVNATSAGASTVSPGRVPNDTVSVVLGMLVLVLAIVIAAIVGCLLLRYWYTKKKGAKRMRYIRAPVANPRYGLYDTTSTTFSNSKDDDDDEAFV